MATNDTNNIVNNQFNVPVQVHSSATSVGSNTEACQGDQTNAENMAKVGKHEGPMYVGGTQYTTYINQQLSTPDTSTRVSDDKSDPLKIFENLPKDLVELGKETSQPFEPSDDETIGHNAGYVPLQIAIYKQNNDKTSLGHLHTREEIIKSHQKPTSDNLEPDSFFEISEQFIRESDHYQKIESAAAKKMYLDIMSKIIGIIGQAGVGKSTLIKNLLKTFVDKKQLFQAKYVFKINLRDFYDKSEISLIEFLLGENAFEHSEWTNDEEVCREVFKLLTDCESVCILLDGLDEIEINPEGKANVNTNTCFKQKPGNFLLALLCGQLFPKAKKIITSRPGQMLDLPSRYKPKFILSISGITQEGLNQICHNMCGNHASQVFRQIEKQPDLKSYSSVPINCVLIIHCIYRFLLNDSNTFKSLPNNITDVFVLSFLQFLDTKHALKKCNNFNLRNLDYLRKISELAWSGIKERKFYFDNSDLQEAKLDQIDISSVTVTVKRQNCRNRLTFLQNATSNCTYFSHLLIQEFFSAIHCLFFMDSKTFNRTFFSSKQFDLQSNQFLMVTKFLFGLANPEISKDLNHIYPDISHPTKHNNLLKGLAKKAALHACKIKDERDQFRSVLSVCSWVYEFQDHAFSRKISDLLSMNIKLCGDILPSDVLSFCYVIKTRTKPLFLSIDEYTSTFFGNAFWQLLDGLQFIQTNSAVQLKTLRLDKGIYIDDESVELLSNLINLGTKEIYISSCKLTPGGFKKVLTQAINSKCQIILDNVTIVFIDDEMSDHVTHMKDDEIENVDCSNSTTQQNRQVLYQILKIGYYNLKTLRLKGIHIDDESVELLSNLINSETKEIRIEDCNLTAGVFEKVLTQAINSKSKIRLDNVRIKFMDDGMSDDVIDLNDDETENVDSDSSISSTPRNRIVFSRILNISYYNISLSNVTIELTDDEMSDHVTHLNDDEIENADSCNSTTQQNRKVSSRILKIEYYYMKKLILFRTNIDDESGELLSNFINLGTKEIYINRCKLTAGRFEKVITQASNLKCEITLCDVSIELTDDEMSDHVTHLNDDEIENLDLDCGNSTTQQNRKVSSRILKIEYYYLKKLRLYNTNIDDESVELLSNLINSGTKEIYISSCKLTAGGFEKFLTQALNSKCEITLCDVSIELTDDEMSDHVTHLNDDEIENLDLDCSNSTTQQNRKVSSRILKIGYYDLKKLILFKTNIDDQSAEVLSNFIVKLFSDDRLEDLVLYDCNVTSRGIEKVSTRLSSLTCPLHSLNIKNNNIGDSGFRSVAACVDKIKFELFIGSTVDEDLTLDGVKAIIEKIKTSPFHMRKLWIDCPDNLKSAVRQELLGLNNKVDEVVNNKEILRYDRSRCSIM